MLPYLKTTDESFVLRPCQPKDAEAVYEAVRESMRELSPWMPWCQRGYSIEESRTWFASRPEKWLKGVEYDFLIARRSDGLPLGICGLNNFDGGNRLANLGYWIRTSQAGKGVATGCVPLVAQFGFEELNLNRIEIIVATGNVPSQGLARKIGAVREGRLRKRLIVGDQVYHAFMFSLVAEDLNISGDHTARLLREHP